jgi:outer membrane protein assembly factor BamB
MVPTERRGPMRKAPLMGMAVVVALVVAGCSRSAPGPTSNAAPEDVLFVRTARGVTLVRGLPQGSALRLPGAVPSIDWSAVVRAIPSPGGLLGRTTTVVALDTSSGAELWSQDVDGTLEVKVASQNGGMVALGRPGDGTGYPVGRSSTTLVIIDEDGSDARTIHLRGNYEPEAFSTDGGSLFVIQYLPPLNPTSYRVRRLDLSTGEVGGVYTVDAELQEAMQGTARIQAASPDGNRLYTLYSLKGADGVMRAFIHVLSLDEEWAHCVDLPEGFGAASEKAVALSVAPDGKRLYVADAAADMVAEVDTEALTVSHSAPVDFGTSGLPANALLGPDGILYLASGTRLMAVTPGTLAPGRSWFMEEKISGIQAAMDGSRLYVGLEDQIVVLETATGKRLGTLSPEDLGNIGQLGQSTRVLNKQRTVVTCAC